MNSIGTPVLIVLGLIASCTAKSLISINNHLDGDASSPSSSEEDARDALNQFQITCYERTGSNDTFEAIVSHSYAIPTCVLVNMDIESFIEDLFELGSLTRHQFFPKYCPKMRRSLQCFEPLLKDIHKCLDEDDALVLKAVSQALPKMIDLICDNDGAMLFLEDTSYGTCMNEFNNYIDECGGKLSNATDVIHISDFGETQCDELGQARNCLAEKLTQCNGPRLMDLFDVIYRAFIRASPCGNFLILPNQEEDNAIDEEWENSKSTRNSSALL